MFNPSQIILTNDNVDVILSRHDGYPEELAKLDTPAAMRDAFGDTNREFPDALWIEPKNRVERARFNDENGLWAGNFIDRFTNQGSGTHPVTGRKGYSTHECTTHSLRCVAEACRNRQRRIAMGGPEVGKRLEVSANSTSVWLACLSVYPEENPREWGGGSVQGVCRIAVDRGFLPDVYQPREYGFRHTMWGTCGKGGVNQSSGPWPGWSGGTFKQHPDGWADENWRETSKNFRPLECIYPRNDDEFDCLLLNGYGIGVGRSGHAVPIIGLRYEGGKLTNRKYPYFDSYDRILFDSRAYTSGSFSILTMTTPDDWDQPAG